MIKFILFLFMIVIAIIYLIALLISGIRWIIKKLMQQNCTSLNKSIKKKSLILLGIILVAGIYTYATQRMTYTPAIKDSNGKTVKGSIAELKKINLNGHDEWISIRGKNKDAPIILFLAGGPGGTQMAATRYELLELEKNFVIVNWDQPGSGKSYNCMKKSDITVQTYIDDGVELTRYLLEQFGHEKIYLMGESWGSTLGIFLIKEKPEYYAGFIGTGQMVDFEEAEIMDYDKAIEIAKAKGDENKVKDLINQGKPPYYKGFISIKSNGYLQYLSDYMTADPNITNGGYHTLREMLASEYGVLDSVNYALGVIFTFDQVYPQLYKTDLRKDYSKLEVPVYFFIGRHDINAPITLAEDYYNSLETPKKELIWFEHSGHDPWRNETDLFVKETLRVFNK